MYEVKNSCGHAGYTKYRFILEACKRAKLKFLDAGKEADLHGSNMAAIPNGPSLYGSAMVAMPNEAANSYDLGSERAKVKVLEVGKEAKLKMVFESLGAVTFTDVSQC